MLGFIRRRLEGALFVLVALARLPRWFATGMPRHALARWGTFIRSGLLPLRESWWTQFQLETARAVWRYVWLLEGTGEPPRARAAPSGPGDITVYTPGHIGDVLHVVPMLRALRHARPDTHITWIVGPWSCWLADRVDYVDTVRTFAPAWYQYHRGRRNQRLSIAQHRAWAREGVRTDALITTASTDLACLFVARSLRPRMWSGVEPDCPLYRAAADQHLRPMERDCFEAEFALKLLQPLGVESLDMELEYTVRPEEAREVRAKLESGGWREDKPYGVLAPGAGWPGKQWPAERFAAVADWMAKEHDVQLVFVGGPDERALGRAIAERAQAPIANLIGETTIPQMAAVLAAAQVVVCNDSGPMHLAAALDVPTVSIFGPTRTQKWAPRGPRHVALRAVEDCPGCIPWHPRASCVQGGRCLKQITIESVQAAIEHVLKARMEKTS